MGTEAASYYFRRHCADLGRAFGRRCFGVVVRASVTAGPGSAQPIEQLNKVLAASPYEATNVRWAPAAATSVPATRMDMANAIDANAYSRRCIFSPCGAASAATVRHHAPHSAVSSSCRRPRRCAEWELSTCRRSSCRCGPARSAMLAKNDFWMAEFRFDCSCYSHD